MIYARDNYYTSGDNAFNHNNVVDHHFKLSENIFSNFMAAKKKAAKKAKKSAKKASKKKSSKKKK